MRHGSKHFFIIIIIYICNTNNHQRVFLMMWRVDPWKERGSGSVSLRVCLLSQYGREVLKEEKKWKQLHDSQANFYWGRSCDPIESSRTATKRYFGEIVLPTKLFQFFKNQILSNTFDWLISFSQIHKGRFQGQLKFKSILSRNKT